MTHFTYRKKDGEDFFLPGIGGSTNGKITLSKEIETSALELVTDENESGSQETEQTKDEEN